MSSSLWNNGVRRALWDDATRTYTEWDENGQQTSQRPYTAQENAEADAREQAETEQANKTSMETKAEAALGTNQTYLDLVSPTNAQASAQIDELTKQMNKVIRLILNKYDSTEGTG